MTPADEDYLERLAICLEGGDVPEARAREVAVLTRQGAQKAPAAAERGDDGLGHMEALKGAEGAR